MSAGWSQVIDILLSLECMLMTSECMLIASECMLMASLIR